MLFLFSDDECIDVTVPLQALVKDSKLFLGAQTDLVRFKRL